MRSFALRSRAPREVRFRTDRNHLFRLHPDPADRDAADKRAAAADERAVAKRRALEVDVAREQADVERSEVASDSGGESKARVAAVGAVSRPLRRREARRDAVDVLVVVVAAELETR